MANALAPMMQRPDQMALPSSGLQTPNYLSPTMPAPSPAAPRAVPNALAASSPYMSAPKKPQNEMLGAAVRGFQRGFDPAGFEKQREDAKADGMEKAKQTLTLMQQQRQLPAEQRAQWWTTNAQQIGQIIGQDLSQQPVDPNAFTDEALDGQIAMLSGKLGIAPSTPEPMSEYQRAQLALEQQKASQPRNQFIQGPDGAISVGNLNDGTIRQLQPGQPKPDPANYDMVTTADGIIAVNKRDPKDRIRIGAAPVKKGDGESGPGGPMDPEFIRLEREYAKDWDRIQKDFSEVNTQYRRVKALGNLAATDKPARSAADLALVVTITKMLDPTSVAREGEVKLTASSASLVDQASNMLNQWQNGQTILPDATRASLLKMADTIFPSYSDAYENRKRDAYTTANEYGFSPKRTMMGADISEFDNMSDEEVQSIFDGIEQAAASPTGSGAVPTEAAAELMRDPSPEALAEFDDAFGPGMAQRVLNGSR